MPKFNFSWNYIIRLMRRMFCKNIYNEGKWHLFWLIYIINKFEDELVNFVLNVVYLYSLLNFLINLELSIIK